MLTVGVTEAMIGNGCDEARKSPKLHQKVSGYWHTPDTHTAGCLTQGSPVNGHVASG